MSEQDTTELTMDARALITAWFAWGEISQIIVGGRDAEHVFSDRGAAAMAELVSKGFVTATPFNSTGRMTYTGTDKCQAQKLSIEAMKKHGAWSPTTENPSRIRRA